MAPGPGIPGRNKPVTCSPRALRGVRSPCRTDTPEWEQDARAQLVKVAADNLGAKAKCKLLVRSGDPAGAILEVEKELRPDLIVMATHGRTGLSHLVLGSVAERTVRESIVPVLTVRGRQSVA